MSRKIYIFNPENDLALANGNENYEAPLTARLLRNDLALLPIWYANENATVLTYSEMPDSWLEKERKELNVNAIWTEIDSFTEKAKPDDCFVPWGWSPAISKLWNKINVSGNRPDAACLARCRALSHRAFTIETLNMLRRKGLLPETFQIPRQLFSLAEVQEYGKKHFPVLWKSPWSSSGRGLFWNYKPDDEKLTQWASTILQKQKSIIAEPVYQKEKDLSMQFFCDEKGVFFAGYSLFLTDKHGMYKGSLLNSDDFIENELSRYIPLAHLNQIKKELSQFFAHQIIPFHRGFFGVDMMICKLPESSGAYFLHPCVEINLRMNMGMVCRLFYDRYITAGSHGIFFIDYEKQPDCLYNDHINKTINNPLKIENRKICSGYLSLSPIKRETHYRARVMIYCKEQ